MQIYCVSNQLVGISHDYVLTFLNYLYAELEQQKQDGKIENQNVCQKQVLLDIKLQCLPAFFNLTMNRQLKVKLETDGHTGCDQTTGSFQ